MIALLLSAIPAVFSYIQKRQSDKTATYLGELNAMVEMRKAAGQTFSLVATWTITLFFLLAAVTPALWYAAIMIDTTFAAIDWGIPLPPKPFDTLSIEIIKTVLGVGIPTVGAAGVGLAIVKKLWR